MRLKSGLCILLSRWSDFRRGIGAWYSAVGRQNRTDRTPRTQYRVPSTKHFLGGKLHGHFATFFSTLAARGSALLAVVVIMFGALLGAPFANFGTKFTIFCSVFAVAGQGLCAEVADVDALTAALGTIVMALFADHLIEAVFAVDQALQAGVDGGLVSHGFSLKPDTRRMGSIIAVIVLTKYSQLRMLRQQLHNLPPLAHRYRDLIPIFH